MKKIIITLFFIPILTLAKLDTTKINNVLLNIHSSYELKFHNNKMSEILDQDLIFTTLEDADIVLFPEEIDNKKMMIADSYKKLKSNKKYIGAIYIKKGRTQIIFIKERLENNGLTLSKSFNKYLLSECQLNPICLLLNE